jgi:hypothetical protein
MIGDVVGRPGRRAVQSLVPDLRGKYGLDLVIANAENAAGGLGLTLATAEELLRSGVDVLTSGNHIWAQREIIPHLDGELPLLRPLNCPAGVPGRGYLIKGKTMVVNLMGRTFMGQSDCPFRAVDELLKNAEPKLPVVVDFHAEATSEKAAMGRYLDGRVAAVLGTHTHVGTIDAQVLPRGTAFITDIGMVGPAESVIGNDIEVVIQKFLSQMPSRLPVAKGNAIVLNSVLVEVDETQRRALGISRIDIRWDGS